MSFEPIQITRIDADHYVVGAVHLRRKSRQWEARPYHAPEERPMFTAPDLEGILDMAHGASEMMRPRRPSGDAVDSMGVSNWLDDHGVQDGAR